MTAFRFYSIFAAATVFAAADAYASENEVTGSAGQVTDSQVTDTGITRVTTISRPDGEDAGEYVPVPKEAIVISGGDNGVHRDVIEVLYDTSDLHFQDATMPRFIMIDRQGNTIFGIGGYVEGIVQYDFDGAIDGAGFATHDIAVPSDPSLRNRLGADATHTNIVLQLLRKTKLGVLNAYVQGNFSGGNYGFKLKNAYISLHNVKAGYTRSTFEDAMAGVPTIDYQGPAGAVSRTNMMLQYRVPLSRHFVAAISAELPQADYTLTDGANESINQRCPDIPAYIQYQWDGGDSHIRASAIFRELSYRNLATSENKFATGWGVQLSGAAKVTSLAQVYYQAVYGKGIANYINDLSGFGYDLLSEGDGGKMKAPGAFGMSAGVRLNLSNRVFVSSTYSFCRLYDQENMGGDAYRRGNYAVVNCFYTPISDLQVGIEYLHGRRTNMNHEHGTANRIEAMVKYSF